MSAPNRLRANAEGFNVNPTAVQPTDPDPTDDPTDVPVMETPPEFEYEVSILSHVNKILEQLGPDAEPELVGNALETASKKNPMDDDDDRPPPTPPPAYAELPPGYEPIVEALAERIEQYTGAEPEAKAGGKPQGADPDAQGLSFEEAFKALDPDFKQTRELTALYRAGFDPTNPRSFPSRIARQTLGQLAPTLEARGTPLSGELISGLQEELGRREAGQASPKAGEGEYYLSGGFGGTSLKEAITRTIAPEFGYGDPKYNAKRTDSDKHADWYLTDPKVPDHPTLKATQARASNMAVGDENPYDIRTWSIGRLNNYHKDPLFHVKAVSKQGKEITKLGSYPQSERLSKAGVEHLGREIERRKAKEVSTNVAIKYGNARSVGTQKAVGGQRRIDNHHDEYLNKGLAPKNYKGRVRAHESSRGIEKKKVIIKPRPPPIQQPSQQPVK